MSQETATIDPEHTTTTYQNYFTTASNHSNNTKKREESIRPCIHCQKALLTCDEGRPCQGCIKRDLSTTCFDGIRKKPKINYTTTANNIFSTINPPFTPAEDQSITENSNFIYNDDTSQLFNFSLTDFGFGSETTGLEYGILGNMLTTDLSMLNPSKSVNNSFQTFSTLFPFNNDSMQQQVQSIQYYSSTPLLSPMSTTATTITTTTNNTNTDTNTNTNTNISTTTNTSTNTNTNTSTTTTTTTNTDTTNIDNNNNNYSNNNKRNSTSSTNTSASTKLTTNSKRKGNYGNTPEAVYSSVKKPFNYAEGFHYLIQYVTEKMNREDLMRISRALSMFRPSFLSLIMNLTEEDLVFMERCFQRTLLEYEKLISFSGTPTVIWRRTGEICLVGKEFSLLTQWTRDMLLNKKTYIYELMENESAVEYWENFSIHAFNNNTDKACSYSCILLTPQQKPVPCTFCFTIKRDIFDLPSVIIGNFLPILS